ncbi:hypothetical protein QR680_007389 [Steinernema hermaphroditum]|uniref:T-complex protein 1 subunit delta n=1 Tax=Steinernema hermaphroditum TaxID=289476 RepID=A0AA39IFJ1_9BILA|nr:hypothetical protein QR680_007389 [Steinernema hermaphroditum]
MDTSTETDLAAVDEDSKELERENQQLTDEVQRLESVCKELHEYRRRALAAEQREKGLESEVERLAILHDHHVKRIDFLSIELKVAEGKSTAKIAQLEKKIAELKTGAVESADREYRQKIAETEQKHKAAEAEIEKLQSQNEEYERRIDCLSLELKAAELKVVNLAGELDEMKHSGTSESIASSNAESEVPMKIWKLIPEDIRHHLAEYAITNSGKKSPLGRAIMKLRKLVLSMDHERGKFLIQLDSSADSTVLLSRAGSAQVQEQDDEKRDVGTDCDGLYVPLYTDDTTPRNDSQESLFIGNRHTDSSIMLNTRDERLLRHIGEAGKASDELANYIYSAVAHNREMVDTSVQADELNIPAIQQENEFQRITIAQLRTDLQRKGDDIERLEKDKQDMHDEIDEILKDIETYEDEVKRLREENTQLASEKANDEEEIQRLQGHLAEVDADVVKLQSEIEEHKQEVAKLSNQIVNYAEEKKAYEAALMSFDEGERKLDEQCAKISEELVNEVLRRKSVEEALETAHQSKEYYDNRKAEVNRIVDRLFDDKEKMLRRIETLQKGNYDREKLILQITKKVAALHKYIDNKLNVNEKDMAISTKPASAPAAAVSAKSKQFKDKDKPESVRNSNIVAAKAVADAIRTSLGPRGMDKMIQSGNGDVTITNDGATILNQMSVIHPTAKMLVELSKAQDVEAGDGTTTVVVMAGALLDAADKLLAKGIHPTTISESFQRAASEAEVILENMSYPVDFDQDEQLVKIASTSLNSKVVSQHSWLLAPMAVNAVKKIMQSPNDTNVNLKMIKIVKKMGETVEESQLINGALIDQRSMGRGGPTRVEKAKIGLIQFQISPPKTDLENQVIISDYAQMDRALKEERAYTLDICKQIKKAGCNVLLIQKSILRDAISEMALHFFAKMKIMVVKDIERDDIEFYSKILGCRPVASVDHFTAEALGTADLVEEISAGDGKLIQVTGVQNPGQAVSILVRGSNKLVLEEAERSLHDALCVVRCLVKKRALIPGGGAPEMEIAVHLRHVAQSKLGAEHYCWRAFADALELIPYTLAENAGLSPISTVTELRNKHADGCKDYGVNVRKGYVTDIREEDVLQPLLVTSSAVKQAAECIRSILKIDDIVLSAR